MMNLFCGRGSSEARRRLVMAGENALIVVPDELSAKNLCAELARAGTDKPRVLDFDSFVAAIAKDDYAWPQSVAPDYICRAIMRNVIESAPGEFDHLVGRYSAPRMSQGVLSRIVSAADALANIVESEDGSAGDSPRRRQLRLLLKRFEERLASAGMQREKLALWQGIIDLTADRWNVQFPAVERVIFADFDAFADEVYLAIAASSKQVAECDVLLQYNPDDDRHGGARLELAYQRLYDMAGRVVDGSDEQAGELEHKTASATELPLVISTESVADEVRGIAASVRAVMDTDAAERPSVVIGVPGVDIYGASLERALQGYGIPWESMESPPLERGAEFLLLERLRQCAGRFVTGAAVADLFRAPGFRALVPESEIASVEAWDLASRLDYVLTLTGQVSGWKAIVKRVANTLSHLQSQRQRTGQLNDEEAMQDERLRELLQKTRVVVEPLAGEQTVAVWAQKVTELIAALGNSPGVGSIGETEKRQELFQQVLMDFQQSGQAVAVEPVSFGYFVALFRTAVYGVREKTSRVPSPGQVLLCSPDVAAKMNADLCIMPGFNDGNFPCFARPDASFSGYDSQPDQRPLRAQQWMQLERLIGRYKRLWFWMPERQGTEELLPSQFAESLFDSHRAKHISATDHLRNIMAANRGLVEEAEAQFAAYLKNVRLSPAELAKFRKYGLPVYNAARAITVMAERHNPQLGSYDGILQDPRLKAWLAAWLDRHKFSVSQLDGIVGCSFRFFADRMLHLDEPEEADDLLPATVFGSFAHDVLARFYRTWVSAGRGVLRSTDEALAREELQRAYYAEYDPKDDLSEFARDLMNLKLFGDLGPEAFGENVTPLDEVSDAGVFGQFLLMEMQRGDDPGMGFLHPSNFEVGFGVAATEEEDPLSTTDCVVMDIGGGETVRLWGRIDRIDVSDTGVFVVTDYKTGHLPTATEIAGGFRTQLPVYMMVAQDLLKKRYDAPDPAGGLYYSLKRGKAARVSGAFVRAAYQSQVGVSGRCMKDEQFVETLAMVKDRIRHSMTALRRGYLTTTRHDPDTVCRYCEFQRLCYRDVERTAEFWEQIENQENAASSEQDEQ